MKKILVLGTGGTIAGERAEAAKEVAYQSSVVGVAQLIGGLVAPKGYTLKAEQIAQIDSKDMDSLVWLRLARRCQTLLNDESVAGILITHGTDTLEETAYFLSCVLSCEKPVVLTCAMRPANAAHPDGPQNLADALTVLVHPATVGVVVVCAGEIHSARAVQKVHPYRINAFYSGEAGPLGLVEEGGVRWLAPCPQTIVTKPVEALTVLPEVAIVLSHAGVNGEVVKAIAATKPAGIIIMGTGNGTVHHSLGAAAIQAQTQGIVVWRSSRCALGSIVAGAESAFPHSALSAVKARIELMLHLSR